MIERTLNRTTYAVYDLCTFTHAKGVNGSRVLDDVVTGSSDPIVLEVAPVALDRDGSDCAPVTVFPEGRSLRRPQHKNRQPTFGFVSVRLNKEAIDPRMPARLLAIDINVGRAILFDELHFTKVIFREN